MTREGEPHLLLPEAIARRANFLQTDPITADLVEQLNDLTLPPSKLMEAARALGERAKEVMVTSSLDTIIERTGPQIGEAEQPKVIRFEDYRKNSR